MPYLRGVIVLVLISLGLRALGFRIWGVVSVGIFLFSVGRILTQRILKNVLFIGLGGLQEYGSKENTKVYISGVHMGET